MRALLLVALLPAAACTEADGPPVTIEGVDTPNTDGDLAPDTALVPATPGLAPDADVTPAPDLEPEATLQPDSLDTP